MADADRPHDVTIREIREADAESFLRLQQTLDEKTEMMMLERASGARASTQCSLGFGRHSPPPTRRSSWPSPTLASSAMSRPRAVGIGAPATAPTWSSACCSPPGPWHRPCAAFGPQVVGGRPRRHPPRVDRPSRQRTSPPALRARRLRGRGPAPRLTPSRRGDDRRVADGARHRSAVLPLDFSHRGSKRDRFARGAHNLALVGLGDKLDHLPSSYQGRAEASCSLLR
jgi:hypothetical protein